MSGGVDPLVQIYASASLHPAKNLVTYLGKFIDINPRFSAMHVFFLGIVDIWLEYLEGRKDKILYFVDRASYNDSW